MIRRSIVKSNKEGWTYTLDEIGNLVVSDKKYFRATYQMGPDGELTTLDSINGFPLSFGKKSLEIKIYFALRRQYREDNIPTVEHLDGDIRDQQVIAIQ